MGTRVSPDNGGSAGGNSIKITCRTDKSLLMKFIHVGLRRIRPRLVKSKSVSPHGSQKLKPHRKATRRCNIHERQLHGIWMYDITRKDPDGAVGEERKERPGAAETERKRVVYFAGGGWQMPPSSGHWALMAEVVNRVPGLTVTLVSYPLAPNSPAASSMPMLRKMYDALMQESISEKDGKGREKVILSGDSSGGNIAICLVTWALSHPSDTESAAPAAILAISPSTDLRHLHAKLKEIEKVDPLLTVPFITSTAKAWSAQGSEDTSDTDATPKDEMNTSDYTSWSNADPRVSPILADLEPLVRRGVRLYCVTGTYDVLSIETHAFREKCNKAGVVGEWLEWERQMHCFPLACSYGLRESKEAVDWIVDVLCRV